MLSMINRKAIITTLASIITIGSISGAVALNSTPQKAGADDSPIVQTLADHSKELANHEARITNTENNVQAVADKTGTTTTIIEQVPATSQAPAEVAPTLVTVTAYEQIPVDANGSMDCKLTYSDGTIYQWHWKTTKKIFTGIVTSYDKNCDSSTIGTTKS